MKNLARSVFWYPGLDRDIEKLVNACPTCIEWGSMPPARQPVPWPDKEEPWSRVHADFAGPVEGACNSGPSLSKDVWFKNYGVGDKWKPGAVESTEGSRMATVKTADGEQHRRHLDQLKTRRTSVGEAVEPEAPMQVPTTKGSQNAVADSQSQGHDSSHSQAQVGTDIRTPSDGPAEAEVATSEP
ncbi:uncharacterized protein [Dermacentor andersoni]|uniref:uncharacterized protein n=1 Tax=Dermacentor andersoni TaxID=34620 RepID=UPI002417A550|nr:uncharacterized protein LOC129380736 [Dermacentor andersoni]